MPALQSSRSAPAMPRDETLRIVRDNVRAMLLSSPAFRAQTPEAQRQIAHDTVTVARFIADAGGATAGVPLTAVITNPAAARTARAAPARPFAPPAPPTSPDGGQTGFDPASAGFDPAATSQLAGQAEALVDAIDFPGFCADLIKGVFTAIVKTSIQQMEAYATMVANVAKSVDQYMQDNVSSEQAMDQLVNGHPELFEADLGAGVVKQRDEAAPDQMGGFLQSSRTAVRSRHFGSGGGAERGSAGAAGLDGYGPPEAPRDDGADGDQPHRRDRRADPGLGHLRHVGQGPAAAQLRAEHVLHPELHAEVQ